MKKQIITVLMACIAAPMMLPAQETNTVQNTEPEVKPAEPALQEQAEKKEERSKEFKKRHLRLMEKALKEIGVTEEQRQKIMALQEVHMDKMKANWKRMNTARRELSRLQDEGAGMEEIDAAIKEVSDAQAEQLKILCTNRKEMETILGKEKNDLLMKKAREFFRKHGRRPGAGMPPRPKPPVPPGGDGNADASSLPVPPIPPAPPVKSAACSGLPPLPAG